MRTPAASIAAAVEVLADGEGELFPGGSDRLLDILERNCKRLLSTTRNLRLASRFDSGDVHLDLRPVEMRALVEDALERAGGQQRGERLTLRLEAPGEAWCRGDRGYLLPLLEELFSNASKFTPDGGAIDVGLTSLPDSVRLLVRNTGAGLTAGEQRRAFEPYFRGSNTLGTAVPGVGLGLAVAEAIAEAHGGSIALASGEGAGVTVSVEIPRGDTAATPR